MYEAALQRAPSDQGSKEGLTAVKTVFANLDAGKTFLTYHFSMLLQYLLFMTMIRQIMDLLEKPECELSLFSSCETWFEAPQNTKRQENNIGSDPGTHTWRHEGDRLP